MSSYPFTRRVRAPAADPAAVSTTARFRRGSGRTAPRLAEGVELLGRFEDSGLQDPPFIARRGDGQVVQMPPVLYALAEQIDGRRSIVEIAARLSHRIQRGVTPNMAHMLIKEKLLPLGVAVPAGGQVPKLRRVDPLTALRLRTKVVPQRWVAAATTVLRPLFWPPVVVAVVLGFLALDFWLFGVHGVGQGLRRTLYDPLLVLMLLGGVLVATTFHELGHATACRYGGARPGVMGVGIYIVWPAFYTDITDAYRLNRRGRLRADTGGIYFNTVFALAVALAYRLTGFEPLLLLIVLQNFTIFQQSLPLLRLDGYYIVSDLTGVPDILMRIGPILRSLRPGQPKDPRVLELKPWVRRVVTTYVLLLMPVVGATLAMMLIHAPRLFATAYDSVIAHAHALRAALREGQAAPAAVAAIQTSILTLPALGLVYTTVRVGRRTLAGVLKWSRTSPRRRGGVIIATATASALLMLAWWPRAEYRPILAGDRGTLLQGFATLIHVPHHSRATRPHPSAPRPPQTTPASTPAATSTTTTTTPPPATSTPAQPPATQTTAPSAPATTTSGPPTTTSAHEPSTGSGTSQSSGTTGSTSGPSPGTGTTETGTTGTGTSGTGTTGTGTTETGTSGSTTTGTGTTSTP